jgi:hypothetical protein
MSSVSVSSANVPLFPYLLFSQIIAESISHESDLGALGTSFPCLGRKVESNLQRERGRMMDTKQLKKILGSLGLAGLLATANLALPGCDKQPPAEQSS